MEVEGIKDISAELVEAVSDKHRGLFNVHCCAPVEIWTGIIGQEG
jgi:hypothetical protein